MMFMFGEVPINIFNGNDGLHYHQKHNLLKFYLGL